MHSRALELINNLKLIKHPEGGYYREIFRSPVKVYSQMVNDYRQAITDIYFLLPKGEVSKFHNVLHDEIWHFYEGDPIILHCTNIRGDNYKSYTLGSGNKLITNYKAVINGGHWQAAETIGDCSLMGCTVGAGFDFKDFKLLTKESEVAKVIRKNSLNDLTRFIG